MVQHVLLGRSCFFVILQRIVDLHIFQLQPMLALSLFTTAGWLIKLAVILCDLKCAGKALLLTLASRFALARRFLSHTMTCTERPVLCLAAVGKQNEHLVSLSADVKNDKKAGLASTCCSMALPAFCTAAINSGVGLECPALKCCSNKLICAWLGFHLGLYTH